MGQKIDLVMYDSYAFGDFSNGIITDILEYSTVPLDVRVLSVTILIETEAVFDKNLVMQVNVECNETTVSKLMEGQYVYDFIDQVLSAETAGFFLVPDYIDIHLFPLIAQTADQWYASTHDVDMILKMSDSALNVIPHLATTDGANPTTGSMDMFIILECEVL